MGISTGVNDPNGTKSQRYPGKIGETEARIKRGRNRNSEF